MVRRKGMGNGDEKVGRSRKERSGKKTGKVWTDIEIAKGNE